MSQTNYKIRVQKTPKDLVLEGRIQQAFEASAQRHGIPLDVAERIFNDVVGAEITVHQAQHAETARLAEQTASINRDRFGAAYNKKIASAKHVLEILGFDLGDVPLEQHIPDANRIERLVQAGERLSAPAATSQQQGTSQMSDPTEDVDALQRKFDEMRADPLHRAKMDDPRNPLHKYADADEKKLMAELVRAKARVEAAASQGNPDQALAELDRMKADPETAKVLNGDKRDPRYSPMLEKWQSLCEQAAKSPSRATGPSAAAIRQGIDKDQRENPVWKLEGQAADKSPEYAAAKAQRQTQIEALAAAEKSEGVAAATGAAQD